MNDNQLFITLLLVSVVVLAAFLLMIDYLARSRGERRHLATFLVAAGLATLLSPLIAVGDEKRWMISFVTLLSVAWMWTMYRMFIRPIEFSEDSQKGTRIPNLRVRLWPFALAAVSVILLVSGYAASSGWLVFLGMVLIPILWFGRSRVDSRMSE